MIETTFKNAFGHKPAVSGFTPGRVNLIGEHTDYNGGFVLPTALDLGLSIAISPRTDNSVRINSAGFEGTVERDLSEAASDHWSDYALGAVIHANKAGLLKGGADLAVSSTLPQGAGLSSSAALTVGILKHLRDAAEYGLDEKDISKLARKVENEYIGMPCGIMDQMAVAIASPGQALYLNTNDLDYDLIDLPKDYHMAVIHSGKFRQLNEGRYKERKEECDVVKSTIGKNALCQMTATDFAAIGALDDVYFRRANHCVTENQRTKAAAHALKSTDMETFGRLMVESHKSMQNDFEISLPEIDKLVEDAVAFGALGARLTGGGFGGCIVACLNKNKLEAWKTKLLSHHEAAFYVC